MTFPDVDFPTEQAEAFAAQLHEKVRDQEHFPLALDSADEE